MIYFDNAATTQMAPEVAQVMSQYLTDNYANPSGITKEAQAIRRGINGVRQTLAQAIGVEDPFTCYFTGGGTEANNWAIKSVAETMRARGKGNHLISTRMEHHSVLHPLEELVSQGFTVSYIAPDKEGRIQVADIEAAITSETILISVMFVNNELGTIQPVAEIGALTKAQGILFHCDGVQALGHLPIDVVAFNIDLLTVSAHKLHGPKGVGALYAKESIDLRPFIHGGAQERNRRAGTENVAGIMAFGEAIQLAMGKMDTEYERLKNLTEPAIEQLLTQIKGTYLNGHKAHRLPGIFNLAFEGIEGEDLIILLDRAGIQAASGAACMSGSLEASHVLEAIGKEHLAHSSLRISLGRYNTAAEVSQLVAVLPELIKTLRNENG